MVKLLTKNCEDKRKKILIYGYGNPGRQDDGLGPALAEAVEKLNYTNVKCDSNYQLNVEDAAEIAEYDIVLFVDASKCEVDGLTLSRIYPVKEASFSSHSVSAESVLAICRDHFGNVPESWMLGIKGYEFDIIEELTSKAYENLEYAVDFVKLLIERWRDQ